MKQPQKLEYSSNEAVPSAHPIDFQDRDVADPLNWPLWHKWSIVLTLSILSASVQLSIVMVAPLTAQIQHSLHTDSASYGTLLVTIWELGEVLGPLLYGPLSEYFGRLPIIHFSGLLFALFSTGCALSTTTPMLLALRFFNGTSVAVVGLSGAIVGDLFAKEHRGPAISIMMVGSRVGPALGPILGGAIGNALGWRWAFWIALTISGACSLVLLVVYRETYRVKILEKKAHALRVSTGDVKIRSKYYTDETSWQRFYKAVIRPFYLITHSWVLAGLSAYVSVFLGFFYLALTSIAPTFASNYKFDEAQSGLAYLGLYVGMILGSAFFTLHSKVQVKRYQNELAPENRLALTAMAAAFVSAGFLIFGWTAAYHKHWIAPIVGTALVGFGYFVTTVTIRAYIVDCFGTYAASASAAMLATRNVPAALLPLAGPPLFTRLGLGCGSSLLSFLGLMLIPVPLFFIKYGARLRESAPFLIQE